MCLLLFSVPFSRSKYPPYYGLALHRHFMPLILNLLKMYYILFFIFFWLKLVLGALARQVSTTSNIKTSLEKRPHPYQQTTLTYSSHCIQCLKVPRARGTHEALKASMLKRASRRTCGTSEYIRQAAGSALALGVETTRTLCILQQRLPEAAITLVVSKHWSSNICSRRALKHSLANEDRMAHAFGRASPYMDMARRRCLWEPRLSVDGNNRRRSTSL